MLLTEVQSYDSDVLHLSISTKTYWWHQLLSNGGNLYAHLMERCVGGFTQNNNETYNQLIWKITPKIVPCGSKIVEIAAYSAASVFNKGTALLLYYMSAMGLKK